MRRALFQFVAGVLLLLNTGLWPAYARPIGPSAGARAKSASEALRRGEELRRKGNLDGAEAAFLEARSLDPSRVESTVGLARVARGRLDFAKAISLLEKASNDHPNSGELLAEYGWTYLAAEESERARRYFEDSLRISDSNIDSIIGLAGVDLLERDYDGATRSLRECLRREPGSASAHAMLARALLETGKNSEAAQEAERAIELDAYDVEALYTLAYVKAIERKAGDALSLARRVVSLDPFNAGARRVLSQYLDGQAGYDQRVGAQARMRYERARALKQEGNLEKAVTEFEAALLIEPRYYRALIGLADACLRKDDYERAAAVAKLAAEVDPDGTIAHLELSCAYRGLGERARIEIGATDFATLFYGQPVPPAYALTRKIFPNYGALTKRQQSVIDKAVAPLAELLPKLAQSKARHYLMAYDQRPGDLHGLTDVADQRTFDGRYYASIRGVGGRIAVSGAEHIDQAARGGFNTIAHEFAHQIHIAALGKKDVKEIRHLYERAVREGRTLDYYASANEHEYFAQGYEAFISDRKRPSAGVTARHTRDELRGVDPDLYNFLTKLARDSQATNNAFAGGGPSNTVCLTRNIGACHYAGCAFPVIGSQQLRLLHTHPRVALKSAQHDGIGGNPFAECMD
ncbi:MAG: tetratricopeptide repeat protein [Blastocatellia bacterium]